MNCDKFCNGPKRVSGNIIATDLRTDAFKDTRIQLKKRDEGFLCPLGFTQDPPDDKKTFALVDAGGKNTICHRNPWKFIKH